MRAIRITTALLAVILCLTAISCSYEIYYPGQVEPGCWVSEDESICFWFPAEAGIGKAQGAMLVGNALRTDLTLEWSKNGRVSVTAEHSLSFSADTVTDKDSRTCTFSVTSQSSKLNLGEKIVFTPRDKMPTLLSEPFKPENTSLDLWMLQDTEKLDLSEYESIPGWFGAEEIYGKGYEPILVDGEGLTDPEYCVKYLISAWPDYSDGGEFVTHITITDPKVTFFGLTIEDSPEEFDRVLKEKGFTHWETSEMLDPNTEYKEVWDNGLYDITLSKENGKCLVTIYAAVTNRNGIMF